MHRRKNARRYLVQTALMAGVAAVCLPVSPARAADLGGNCCADLEERIAELETTASQKGNQKVSLTIEGRRGGHVRPGNLGPGGGLGHSHAGSAVTFSKGSYDVIVPTGLHGQLDVLTPGTPYLKNNRGRVLVLDTSSFTHEDHARRSVFNSVDQTLGGALGGSIACAAPADEAAPLMPQQCARRGVWASAIGGYTDIDATRTAFAAGQTLVGGLAGAHFDAAPGITAGLFGGFAETDLSTEYDAEHVETSFAIAGAFARIRNDQGFADLSVTGLWSDSDRRRDIASNIGGTDHFETVTANANGWMISPALTLGLRMPVAAETTLVPAIKVRGTIGQSGGYSETGAFSAISIGARDIADLDSRIEVSVHKSFAISESLSGMVRATAGVSYFGIFGDRTFHGPVRGIEGSTSTVNEKNEFGGYVGVGLDVPLSDTASLFADTEMHLTDRAQSISGFGGVKVKF